MRKLARAVSVATPASFLACACSAGAAFSLAALPERRSARRCWNGDSDWNWKEKADFHSHSAWCQSQEPVTTRTDAEREKELETQPLAFN